MNPNAEQKLSSLFNKEKIHWKKTNKTKIQSVSLGTWTVTKDITFMPLGRRSQKQRIKTVIWKKYLKK